MTTTRTQRGKPLHFPGCLIRNALDEIEPPPTIVLSGIAEAVHRDELLLFSKRLVDGARKRRREPRWRSVNRSRLILAQLCIRRALDETGRSDDVEADDETVHALAAEIAETFGEEVARALAEKLGAPFAGCASAARPVALT